MSNLRIECVVSNLDMGYASEDDARVWAEYVDKRLKEEYPGADVRVSVNCQQSGVQIIDGEGEEGVREFLKALWDREFDVAFPLVKPAQPS